MISRIARRFLAATGQVPTAAEFAGEFFKAHPHLKRFTPSKVVDKVGGGGSHPEARQAGSEIQLFPKFWNLDAKTKEFVFTHEIGHYVLAHQYSLAKLIQDLSEQGIDA